MIRAMRQWRFSKFGVEALELVDIDSIEPGPGQVRLRVEAASLNYRDLLVVDGAYNPRLSLPATPLSDGAGTVTAVGDGVSRVAIGDRVMTHFITGWIDGPFEGGYVGTTLGTPGPGVAAEEVVVDAEAVVRIPGGFDSAEAATLPIAALTAWSALMTEGALTAGQTVLTLGTGGVSIFALQLAKAMAARVIVTSSSDHKLERCRALGADETINYSETPDWHKRVMQLTDRHGVDVVVENGGVGTLSKSVQAVRAGGTVALLGALTGLQGEVNIGPILMRRVRVAGIMVDCRRAFEELCVFLAEHPIEPVIDARFTLAELPAALEHLRAGRHFGKIVLDVG